MDIKIKEKNNQDEPTLDSCKQQIGMHGVYRKNKLLAFYLLLLDELIISS